jgi:hypothetical protein
VRHPRTVQRADYIRGTRACRRWRALSCLDMLGDMRKYVKDRIDAISPQGAEDLAATFMTMASAAAEHLSGLATGLMERSAEARAALLREIKELIAAQIEEMGVATKKDVATLRARLDRLEAKGASSPRKAAPKAKSGGGARTARRTAPATRGARSTSRRPPGAR